MKKARCVRCFFFPGCGAIWERQVDLEETRESKAERRQFRKSLRVSDCGDSVEQDVEH